MTDTQELAQEVRVVLTERHIFSLLDDDGYVRHHWLTTEASATRYAMRYAVPSDRGLVGPTGLVVATGRRLFDLAETAR